VAPAHHNPVRYLCPHLLLEVHVASEETRVAIVRNYSYLGFTVLIALATLLLYSAACFAQGVQKPQSETSGGIERPLLRTTLPASVSVPAEHNTQPRRDSAEATEQTGSLVANSNVSAMGIPSRGPHDAPITIVEFADFQCPYCAGAESTIHQLLVQYPDQVKLVFKDFPLDFHADSMLAHHAALAANEQGKFWEMHDLIFANQRAMKRDDLLRHAQSLGLDMNRFIEDMDSGRFRTIIEAGQKEGIHLGVDGTPSFLVNGKLLVGAQPLLEFKKVVEEGLAASKSANSPSDDLLGGNLTKGPADAPITILWFSDLQSPLTSPSAQLLQQVMDAFPGSVRLQFKNFPLAFHADSALAHEVALAAGAQGKFWEMQELITRNQKALKEEDLLRFANQLGLDTEQIATALVKRTYRAAVERDLAEGQRRDVRGAPVFFVNAKRFDGLQAFDVLKQAIEEELKKTSVAAQ
jgi:protein-disulfide isomerase